MSTQVKVSKADIIKLAEEGKTRAEVAEILGITVTTLTKLLKENNLNIEFKAKRNKYVLVDDLEVFSGVNPIIHQEVMTDAISEVSNITNTQVTLDVVEDNRF